MATASVQAPSVLTLALPQSPESIGKARRVVRGVLTARGWPEELVASAVLVVCELVTNAVVHGLPPVGLRVQVVSGFVAGRVTDRSSERPILAAADVEAEGGRGLAIVQAMADRWGTYPLPGSEGKAVWFEFRGPPDPVRLARSSPVTRSRS
ncbi:ATP-binding protein [Nonomuraea longicatena]|uniref:Histidine kinase/HSP90-like ATPase domain-containing protein n=1 Tax=Nonomuraea longicatena TaxID=83682 RepID=A0ABN1P9G8_9ACTN